MSYCTRVLGTNYCADDMCGTVDAYPITTGRHARSLYGETSPLVYRSRPLNHQTNCASVDILQQGTNSVQFARFIVPAAVIRVEEVIERHTNACNVTCISVCASIPGCARLYRTVAVRWRFTAVENPKPAINPSESAKH